MSTSGVDIKIYEPKIDNYQVLFQSHILKKRLRECKV